jgi:hypothetical protein
MRGRRGTVAVLCTGFVLANVPLAPAQDATSANVPELSKMAIQTRNRVAGPSADRL